MLINRRLIHNLKNVSFEHGLSFLRFGQYVRAVVPKLFVPKAHQRTSKNLKAHLLCKIALITRVITHIM